MYLKALTGASMQLYEDEQQYVISIYICKTKIKETGVSQGA